MSPSSILFFAEVRQPHLLQYLALHQLFQYYQTFQSRLLFLALQACIGSAVSTLTLFVIGAQASDAGVKDVVTVKKRLLQMFWRISLLALKLQRKRLYCKKAHPPVPNPLWLSFVFR